MFNTMGIPLAVGLMTLFSNNATGQGINITAISAVNGSSVFECWNLNSAPFGAGGAANYPIGNSTNAFIGVIPPRTIIGQAFASSAQYSIVMSGLVHLSLPDSTDEIYVQGGSHGIIIAADTRNVSQHGHITEFPSDNTTVIAQFPISGNLVPAHTVLHVGGCQQ